MLSGALIDTATFGAKSFTVTAIDVAGNGTTTTVGYSVPFASAGVLSPLSPTKISVVDGGSAPVKFQIFDSGGKPLSTLTPVLHLAKLMTGDLWGPDFDPTSTSAPKDGTVFRYDTQAKQYIYNLSTKVLVSGIYRLRIAVGGGAELYAQIQVSPPSNRPPGIAAANASVSVGEGQTATNAGTWSDPDDDPVSLSASVGCVTKKADGTWAWSWKTSDGPADSRKVTIAEKDGKGGLTTASFDLIVLNVAPTVALNSACAGSVTPGSQTTWSGTFSDPGALDTHSAVWTWGDGTSSPPRSARARAPARSPARAATPPPAPTP